jgi:protein-S-isoprenylcysteine O-methyltransferase Ste14
MRPAFAGQPLAMALFFATIAVWAVFEARQGLRRRPGATREDRGSIVVMRLLMSAGIVLAALALGLTRLDVAFSPWVFVAGIALIWAGVGLRLWSFATLGHYFTFTVQTSADQPLIASGPYRWVRHPGYLALLLIFLGIGIAYGNLVSLVALVGGVAAGLAYRIRVEEAALRQARGAAFDEYAAGRKRLLPFVW